MRSAGAQHTLTVGRRRVTAPLVEPKLALADPGNAPEIRRHGLEGL